MTRWTYSESRGNYRDGRRVDYRVDCICCVSCLAIQTRVFQNVVPTPESLERPAHNDVYVATGYDYKTRSYRIWMSPMMELPYTQERFDAYLEAKEIASVEYTDDGTTSVKTGLIQKTLKEEGWRVHVVDPPELLAHLPGWVKESGGEMKNRDALKDAMVWAMRGRKMRLRKDLQHKVDERDRRARQDAEFNRAMRPLPDWVKKSNNEKSNSEGHSVQLSEDQLERLELYREHGLSEHYFWGHVYAEEGDHDRAIAEFDAEIALDTSDPLSYSARGDAYVDSGDLDRGIQDHDTALALIEQSNGTDEDRALLLRARGNAYIEKGDFDMAIIDLGDAILLDPLNPQAYGFRAVAYEQLGEYEEAQDDLETYNELMDEQDGD